MPLNDFLVVLDREAQTLAEENNHSAAAIMREAGERLRALRDQPKPYSPYDERGRFVP